MVGSFVPTKLILPFPPLARRSVAWHDLYVSCTSFISIATTTSTRGSCRLSGRHIQFGSILFRHTTLCTLLVRGTVAATSIVRPFLFGQPPFGVWFLIAASIGTLALQLGQIGLALPSTLLQNSLVTLLLRGGRSVGSVCGS
jgi:hypothetical protein